MTPRTKKLLVSIATAAALVFVAYLLFRYFRKTEGFEGSADLKDLNPKVELTPTETELFENLVNNAIDDASIKKMIESGQLTDKVVEKFLSKLNIDIPEDFEDKEKDDGEGFAEEKEEEGFEEDKDVEGFTGTCNGFAKF